MESASPIVSNELAIRLNLAATTTSENIGPVPPLLAQARETHITAVSRSANRKRERKFVLSLLTSRRYVGLMARSVIINQPLRGGIARAMYGGVTERGIKRMINFRRVPLTLKASAISNKSRSRVYRCPPTRRRKRIMRPVYAHVRAGKVVREKSVRPENAPLRAAPRRPASRSPHAHVRGDRRLGCESRGFAGSRQKQNNKLIVLVITLARHHYPA